VVAGESGLSGRLGWYARRLQSMEKGEIRWRAEQVLHRFRLKTDDHHALKVPSWEQALESFRAGADRPVFLDRDRARAIAEREPELVAGLVAAADRVAEYSFSFFGYPEVSLHRPVDWHHDPFTDRRWPDAPSHRIDHRVASGDVKWIWELNRLQHLPLLAQAWLFTGDNRYSAAAFEHLDTWIDQNPFGQGIAWRGAFEAGLRSVSIAVALQGLRDAPELTSDRYRRIVGVLAESAHRCWTERSLFSSANNHLVGEMAGLAVVATMFPELRSAQAWECDSVKVLCGEAGKQILPDGVGAEQSVGYQMATVELLHLVAALLYQRDGRAPAEIADAIRRSSEFLSAAVGDEDPDPRYGDNDQEFALRLGPEPVRSIRDHLGVVSALGWGASGPAAQSKTLSARWFGSIAASDREARSESSAPNAGEANQSFFAPDGGLVVLRRGRRRTTMDVGRLGYLSIAAHGHADALAVTVSDGGMDVIGDPGTGSYYQHPDWRTVMRGTRAHATVCIDGHDQSTIGGPFLWTQHAQVRVRGVDLDAGIVDAEHDGYTRLPGRITHRRWLIAPPGESSQLVVDWITGTGSHEVRTCWPIDPSVHVTRAGDARVLLRDDVPIGRILHAATALVRCDDSNGDEQRSLGWWSERLEDRVPAWWLSSVCAAELPVAVATLISLADGAVTTADLRVAVAGDIIEVSWFQDSHRVAVDVRVDRAASITRRTDD